nr:hypothetical protein [Tanacetum cinerariifolium]
MDLFAFINHAYPTMVRIRERGVREGEVMLLESTIGRVVPLAGVNEQRNQNDDVKDARNQHDDVQDAGNNVTVKGAIDGQEIPVDAGIVCLEDEVLFAVAEKAKGSTKKMKYVGGASGSNLPPKKLRADHGNFSVGASTGGKSVAMLQAYWNTVSYSGSSYNDHSIATTVVAAASTILVPRASDEPAHASSFMDSTSIGMDMDSETLRQIYVPKLNVVNESALNDPDVYHSLVDQLAHPVIFSKLHGMDYEKLFMDFNVGAVRQTCLGAKVTEAAEAMHLRSQVATIEAAEATRVNEHNSLKERNSSLVEETNALEYKVAALEIADAAKVTKLASLSAQTAKLTQDLSKLGLSCDELSVKASSLEAERDRLVGQVSLLEGTCFELCDEISTYKLFKEHIEAVQEEQVKVLSDKVARLDVELTRMALHLDKEFYPHFLTTIAERRWILGRSLKLMVMNFRQYPKYLVALGGAIGRAIDKGMQDGLAVSIDHEKAGRGLVDIAAYDPFAKANYVFAVNALRSMDFPLLA